MSTQDLFGDEDSSSEEDEEDEEDDEPKQQKQPKKPDEKPKKASSGDEDDDDDDKDEPAAKEKPKRPTLHDSDSDDDEDEFDDNGAVVGVAPSGGATRTASAPAPAAAAARSDDDDDPHRADDDNNNNNKNNNSPSKQQQRLPPVDNRPLTLPKVNRPQPNVSMHITKLPNLIGIKSTPFDPDDYSPTIEEEDYGPSAVHNLMRWRYKRGDTGHILRDGKDKLLRESNSRLVEWEDGTWTLQVGVEIFEVDSKSTATPDGFAALNGYLYLSQPASVLGEEDDGKPAGTVLECFGGLHSRLTARPSSLQSEAHKALTVAVRQRTIKKARIAEIATAEDPEKVKQERIRLKSDLEKANAKKKSSGGGGGSRRIRMARGYLDEEGGYEDDGDYDDIDIGRTKRRMRDGDDYEDYAEEEEEDLTQDKTFNTQRPTKRVRKEEYDDDIVMQADDDDDEEDEDAPRARAKPNKKPAHRAVFDDEDDDDE